MCFSNEQDFAAYVSWLKDYAKKYQVDIHAWVLMTNHVHLLCTPRIDNAVSRMMQALGRHYVRYFNVSYRRTGKSMGSDSIESPDIHNGCVLV